MKKITSIISASAVGLILSLSAHAGTVYNYTMSAKSHSGSRDRNYDVYVPSGLSGSVPMVMALHGCVQDKEDVMNDWGFKAVADANGFILVTPSITSYDGQRSENCWGFWFDQHTHEGMGEPEDLHQIALEVESNYNIDPDRRYITGLSSGGAMTVVAAVTHNEYWAAAAPAAALAYGETSSSVSLAGCYGSPTMKSVNAIKNSMNAELDDDYEIPLLVMANNEDCVVQQPAGTIIRDAHIAVFGGSEAQDVACEFYYQNNYGCRHTYYTTDGLVGSRSVVETVFYDGPLNTPASGDNDYGHYWVAGSDGNEAHYNRKVGPSYPELAWDFFDRHPKNGASSPIGVPVITMSGDNPMKLDLNDAFTDPGASATDLEDGTLSVTADCNVDTSTVGEYYCTYTAEDSAGNKKSVSRTIIVSDPNAPAETCAESTASPSDHISAGRAVKGGSFDLYALSKSDSVQIGSSFDTWSSVTLYEGEPGKWYSAQPAACGGEAPGGGGSCTDWYASNYSHYSAGRATNSGGYAVTVGGNDNLGLNNTYTYTYVKETSSGFFEQGQCP